MKSKLTKKPYGVKVNPIEEYKGFQIIQVHKCYYYYSNWERMYDACIVTSRDGYFSFTDKGVDAGRENNHYQMRADSVEACRNYIDKFVSGEFYVMTHTDYAKNVCSYVAKCGYGFTREQLYKMEKDHQKGDLRTKYIIEERLTDANYHSYCDFLADGKYKEFHALAREEASPTYSYTIDLKNYGKNFDPKRLESHIFAAVADYLREHNMCNGEVNVKAVTYQDSSN